VRALRWLYGALFGWWWAVIYRNGICEAPCPPDDDDLSELYPYVCTLPAQHRGLHVAQAPDRSAIAVWGDE
jgi:hypothetical protein